MDIFNIISLGGGLALFLFGMNILGTGLEKVSSGRMEKTLEKLTNNVFTGVLLGALVTAAIQSSSATTVIVVGMVNAGILKLRSAVGVIMGANIGTTVTGQILRLGDLENNASAGTLMQFFKPTTLAPLVAIIGILIFMISKRPKRKVVGEILIGFGILFQGMFSMEAAVRPLQESEILKSVFVQIQDFPLLGVLVGAVVTAIIQSSSASVGILQALSSTGAITYSSAFPIIMGQNIGTCITPLLASIGANKNAKRAAMVHLYFNIIGTIVFLAGVYLIQHFVGFPFWYTNIDKGGIANIHTIFNIVVTLLFIPFAGGLARLAEWTVRQSKSKTGAEEEETTLEPLDERFLVSPALAIGQSENVLDKMGSYALKNFREVVTLFDKYDLRTVERINEIEDSIDKMEDNINNYLLRINEEEITEDESKDVTLLLRLVSEFERIGDYAINLMERAEVLYDKQVKFSEKAMREFHTICDAVEEIVGMALEAYRTKDISIAVHIEPLEETIDTLEDTLKLKHIKRLKNGQCTIDAGLVFLEVLTNLERISDHCSNIGVYLIGHQRDKESLNRHEYIKKMHQGATGDYNQMMQQYMDKYMLEITGKDMK